MCCENSAVPNILRLGFKNVYTKLVSLFYSQGGPGAPAAQRARYGPVQVLGTVQVQVLYKYFRVPVRSTVPYSYFRVLSFKVYIFRVEMHYIMNCRVNMK